MFFIRADETERKYKKAEAFVERLAHSISAKAVYGELVVRYPKYEPASALLKRSEQRGQFKCHLQETSVERGKR